MIRHRFSLTPRYSDLDTQRHVTSRTYEHFCQEGRLRCLDEKFGLSINQLIDEKVRLVPVANHVKFFREQQPGTRLRVETEIWPGWGNRLYWVQRIIRPGGKNKKEELACRVVTVTDTVAHGRPLDLFEKMRADKEAAGLATPRAHTRVASEREIPEITANRVELSPSPPFTGNCEQVTIPFPMLFSDRTPFYDYSPAALWRIFEEGRWYFGQAVGLTMERIMATDTITFFTGATFHYFEIPPGGTELEIRVWVEKVEKIRAFFRQEVVRKADQKVLMDIREEQLIVSLSRRRPVRASAQWLESMLPYMEKKPSE